MRRFAPTVLLPICALAFVALAPDEALAQPPDADDFEDGPYVYAAPGIGALPFGTDEADRADDVLDLSYQTQLGGGYFLRRSSFMMAFGATAEFMVYNFDHFRGYDPDGLMMRLLPEVRLGGGGDWFFIYGNIKPGFALSYVDWDWNDCDRVPGWLDNYCNDDGETEPGFNMGFGGGAAFKIWRGLTVGAESGFDFAFFPDAHYFEQVWTADFIMYAGWWF
jgi:hypothetical protein